MCSHPSLQGLLKKAEPEVAMEWGYNASKKDVEGVASGKKRVSGNKSDKGRATSDDKRDEGKACNNGGNMSDKGSVSN